ncbi:trigger factor [Butyrivibrio sp. MC2013]|uniref:trigger factor n=1 Tax=Butyrivibrio sp. MC2013 TaxID=1280686 RepID=UPI000422EFA7|nr:trigger factor [Butyrivibrio sp. MC2013]
MKVNVEKLEKSMAKLTIEVPAEEFEKAIEETYKRERGRIQIPGFRKGKAPRKMIENMYGSGVFYEDAANSLINNNYPQALKECGEEVVSDPKIDVTQIEAGKDFIFTAEVALKPPVSLGKYKGISVSKQDTEVTDADVDAELETERNKNSRMVDITDRAVKKDDLVKLDFEGSVDGVAFDGGKGTDYPLTIGSGSFIPGFEDQLIGAEIDKETEVNVTFPEDYQEASLAGKAAVFKCTVKGIKEKQLPELNDEFASNVSEFETLDEFKEDLKKRIADRKTAQAKAAKEDECVKALIEDSEMELPEAMVKTQQKQIVNEFAQRMQYQGLTMEQYFQYTGTNAEKMMEQVKPQAEERIKSRLVLEAVVAAEGIEASEDDVNEQIKKMAEQYRMDEAKVRDLLGDDLDQLKKDIAVQKAADFIVENAKESKKAKKADKE